MNSLTTYNKGCRLTGILTSEYRLLFSLLLGPLSSIRLALCVCIRDLALSLLVVKVSTYW